MQDPSDRDLDADGDRQPCAGVGHEVGELVGGGERVRGHEHGAERGDGEPEVVELGGVRQVHVHAVAGVDAASAQGPGRGGDAVGEPAPRRRLHYPRVRLEGQERRAAGLLGHARGERPHGPQPLAATRRVSLCVGPLEGTVRADPRRLRQILINLVTNGVRYNRDEGWVRVTASTGTGRALIAVSDSGPGIATSGLPGPGIHDDVDRRRLHGR